uniref:Uncharacterized protein n=1 Tax=Kalanchoe fedtschenkoi TaxID=63787 RepID=A0A7N0ZUI5_KALFE
MTTPGDGRAVNLQKSGRKRKRRKLVVGEDVEVRSDEEGFQGSWHAGRITSCVAGFRSVRYHHLLDNDGVDHLVDRIAVSENLDGEMEARGRDMRCANNIRPLRQAIFFSKFDLYYGLCVEALHNDAWWEGVVFDHEDGAEKRSVFFPDLGDEMVFEVEMLRQAWDWDEWTEGWSERGEWIFLKVVEESEKKCPLTVSVKQLWYDLQEKECFRFVGKWKCCDEGFWREPVLEVISGYFEMTFNDLCDSLGSLTDLDSEPGLLKYTMEKTDKTDLGCSHEIVLAMPALDNGHRGVKLPMGDGRPSVARSEAKNGLDSDEGHCKDESFTRPVGVWLPAENVLVSEPEFCPGVVNEYLRVREASKRNKLSGTVRKHLLSLGWKIEYRKEPAMTRLRYNSPTGKTYMSLIKICEAISADAGALVTVSGDKVSRPPPTDQSNKMLLKLPEVCQDEKPSVTPTSSADAFFEPYYLPEAVGNWCRYIDCKGSGRSENGELHCLEAKQHLAFMGWRFSYVYKNNRRQLRYLSPRGRSYNSLRRACEAYIKGNGTLNSGTPGDSNPRENMGSDRGRKRVREAVMHSSNPRTVLSWLIENNTILPRAKVQYLSGKDRRILKEGRVSREGIRCNCCDKIYSLTEFGAHAGCSVRTPSANIYVKDGRSLLECQRQLLNEAAEFNTLKKVAQKEKHKFPNNDSLCSICHYAGDLLLCDSCPSSFHLICLGLKEIPDGDWFCPSCCCVLCGRGELRKDISQDDVLRCYQCEHQYHLSCLQERNGASPDMDAPGNRFCSTGCKRIRSGLNELLGRPFAVGSDNLTWSLISAGECGSSQPDSADMDTLTHNRSKLHVALSVMHECFEPLKDPRTKRDIVEDVIFSRSSEHNRLNYRGFYTVLLEQNEELITVANVRIFGDKVAEVPLVGTRFQFRRLGMCRYLMNELEKKLMGLGIERLVLPAVPTVLKTWTNSFGFSPMTASERLQFLSYTFLDFQGTTLCQKFLPPSPPANTTPSRELQFRIVNVGGHRTIKHVVPKELGKCEDSYTRDERRRASELVSTEEHTSPNEAHIICQLNGEEQNVPKQETPEKIRASFKAWRHLYEMVRPELDDENRMTSDFQIINYYSDDKTSQDPASFAHPAPETAPITDQSSQPEQNVPEIVQKFHELRILLETAQPQLEELNISTNLQMTDVVNDEGAEDQASLAAPAPQQRPIPPQPEHFNSSESPNLERNWACLDIINLKVYKRRRL